MSLTMPLDFGDERLRTDIESSLATIEDAIHAAIASEFPFATSAADHLVSAGGKRFRPLLTLLAAHAGDASAWQVVPAAVIVELTHAATLYHDDVMDEAPLRRGRESANSRWGNTVAILTGDFLFAKVSQLLADLGPEAVRIHAHTFERLCIGQINETRGPAQGMDPVDHHIKVLADKTGSLISTSLRYGAMFSGCSPEVIEALATYGERIGVAFQLADDLVDLTSDSADSGKTPGTDIREGVPTLTTLLIQREASSADSALLEALAGPVYDEKTVSEVLASLRDHRQLDQARQIARTWSDEARASLGPLPTGPVRDALDLLCDYVVERTA
jgi:heptaprenyl diphosphate synthase